MTNNLPVAIRNSAKAQGLILSDVNLIMPTETYGSVMGEFDKLTIETIKIDANDPRETYEPNGKGKGFALGKVALNKIASGLSIQWHPQYTGVVESTPTKSRAKAVGIMQKPNGETITMTDEKTIDVLNDEEDLRDKAEKEAEGGKIIGWDETANGKKFPKKEPWKSEAEKQAFISTKVAEGIKQKRKFKDELALTGAKDRVIRSLLALKSTYTFEELSKPFAFPRVSLDTSKMLGDPQMRGAALKMLGPISLALFGQRLESEDVEQLAEAKKIADPSESDFMLEKIADPEPDPKLLRLATLQDMVDRYEKNLKPAGIAIARKAIEDQDDEQIQKCLSAIRPVLVAQGINLGGVE